MHSGAVRNVMFVLAAALAPSKQDLRQSLLVYLGNTTRPPLQLLLRRLRSNLRWSPRHSRTQCRWGAQALESAEPRDCHPPPSQLVIHLRPVESKAGGTAGSLLVSERYVQTDRFAVPIVVLVVVCAD